MSAHNPQQIPLSSALQAHLKTRNIKQQELADVLSVDVRTLRRWLSGQTVITDVRELRRIADILQVAPESLGVTSSLYIPLKLEQFYEVTQNPWKHINSGKDF